MKIPQAEVKLSNHKLGAMPTFSLASFKSLGLVPIYTYSNEKGAEVVLQRRGLGSSAVVNHVVTKRFYPEDGKTLGRLTKDWKWPREVQIVERLRAHPNIVALLYQYSHTPRMGEGTVVFEHCRGGDLRDFTYHALEFGRQIPEVFVWKVGLQLLQALAHCHEHGFAHGDLTNDNVFLQLPQTGPISDWPEVKLGGFRNTEPLDGHAYNEKVDSKDVWAIIRSLMLTEVEVEDFTWSKELQQWSSLARWRRVSDKVQPILKHFGPVAVRKMEELKATKMPVWMIGWLKLQDPARCPDAGAVREAGSTSLQRPSQG